MSDEVHMGRRFSRLLTLLGATTLLGLGLLLVLSDEVAVGAILLILGFVMFVAFLAGGVNRQRPYRRIELIAIWITVPVIVPTLAILSLVGFLPTSFGPWMTLYLLLIAVIYLMMIREARRRSSGKLASGE